MRVLIADDRTRVRFALRVLLARQPGLEIVGEVVHTADLVDGLATTCPDLILLDWELPGLAEAGSLRTLRQACPYTAVIVLSGRSEARQAALTAGADAFVSKADPPECLLAAITTLCPGPRDQAATDRRSSQK